MANHLGLVITVLLVGCAWWIASYWEIVQTQYPLEIPKIETPESKFDITWKTETEKVQNLIEEIQTNAQTTIELTEAAVGYNTNLDLVCDGVELMNLLHLTPEEDHQSFETINSLKQFASTFGYYFAMGSAAERYVSTKELWDEIIAPLRERNFEGCKLHPGGNAALIGNRFADLGISVFLGGPVGETLSPLLNPSIRIQQDEQNPIQDEIHLILEFATGQTWENLVSPRANRFIVSHDIQNSQLSFVEKFHQELQSPQLAVLAGAHLLEALNEPLRSERLSALANAISSIPKEIVVHLEIAGVGNATFLADFAQKILPLVDSIGLNEQELGMLYSALGGQEFQSSDFVSPLLRTASRSIGFIMGLPMFLNNQGDHQLNRVHLHFLSYHLIAQPVQSREGVYQWDREKAKASVASGSLATTIQACGVDGEFPDVAQLRVDPRVANSGSFEEFNLEFWVSPVVICKVPIRTVGLGDCISASGLAAHFKKKPELQKTRISLNCHLYICIEIDNSTFQFNVFRFRWKEMPVNWCHSLFWTEVESFFTCGYNESGQLGTGDTIVKEKFTQVNLPVK